MKAVRHAQERQWPEINRSDRPNRPASRGNVISLLHRKLKPGLEIGPETTVPLWEGERTDDGMALEGLLQRE